MQAAVLILIAVTGLALSVLVTIGLRRLSRRIEGRAARSAATRSEALARIPVSQRLACYGSVIAGLASFLVFFWASQGSEIQKLAVIAGIASLTYIVWFSVRWRHLR